MNSRKPQLMHAEHAEHARRERAAAGAHARDHRHGPERQHQDPQQHRAFVRAPQRRHAIEQRQRGVGILGHVAHREIVADEGMHQHCDRERDEHELAAGGRRRRGEPALAAAAPGRPGRRTPAPRPAAAPGSARSDRVRRASARLAGGRPAPARRCVPACSERATSGGMYFSSCLASTSSAMKVPLASRRPCATTPAPSRNRSGSTLS